MDWTNVLNDTCTAVVTVAALIGANKKWPWLFKAIQIVEQNAGTIVHVAEEIVNTPIGAAVKHHLQVEVDKVTEQFKKSEIARLALVGLHSFGTISANLSDTQKAALVKFVTDNCSGATAAEVENALEDIQKAASDFAGLEIVKAANYFTEVQAKPAAPVAEKLLEPAETAILVPAAQTTQSA